MKKEDLIGEKAVINNVRFIIKSISTDTERYTVGGGEKMYIIVGEGIDDKKNINSYVYESGLDDLLKYGYTTDIDEEFIATRKYFEPGYKGNVGKKEKQPKTNDTHKYNEIILPSISSKLKELAHIYSDYDTVYRAILKFFNNNKKLLMDEYPNIFDNLQSSLPQLLKVEDEFVKMLNELN